MAFIRQYSEAGDPGFGSFFKKLGRGVKKVGGKAFRLAKKVAPLASFVPGIAPFALAGKLGKVGRLGMKAARIYGKGRSIRNVLGRRWQPPMEPEEPPGVIEVPGAEEEEFIEEEPMDFDPQLDAALSIVRAYGFEVGDPGPAPSRRRRNPGAGPNAKAGAEREVRATTRAGGGGGPGRPNGRHRAARRPTRRGGGGADRAEDAAPGWWEQGRGPRVENQARARIVRPVGPG